MTDIKLLLKEFERYAYGRSKHTAFTELLNWTLLPFKKFETGEEQRQAVEPTKRIRRHPNWCNY